MPSLRTKARIGYDFTAKHIYEKTAHSLKNYDVCNRMAMDLLKSSIRVFALLMFGFIVAISGPLYKICFTDEKEMFFPVILPFIDPDTKRGFYINIASQSLTCAGALFIVPGCEEVICISKINVLAIAAVIQNELMDLRKSIEHNKQYLNEYNYQFRNLVLQIQDYNRFKIYLPIFN